MHNCLLALYTFLAAYSSSLLLAMKITKNLKNLICFLIIILDRFCSSDSVNLVATDESKIRGEREDLVTLLEARPSIFPKFRNVAVRYSQQSRKITNFVFCRDSRRRLLCICKTNFLSCEFALKKKMLRTLGKILKEKLNGKWKSIFVENHAEKTIASDLLMFLGESKIIYERNE